MDRITIYPDKDLLKNIDKEAEEEMRSINNLIIKILKDYFGDKK